MKLISIFVLLMFSMMGCSQSNSQSNRSKKVVTPVFTNDNGSPPEEKQPTVVDSHRTWSGKVGVNNISWDGKDLWLKLEAGKQIGIFSELAKSDYKALEKMENTKGCSTNYYYRPLAIAGNFVSFEYESGFLCGSINTKEWGYSTFELASDGRFVFYRPDAKVGVSTADPAGVALSDIFAEDDVFAALMADERISSDISKLLGQGKIDKTPRNLTELRKVVERFQDDFLGGQFFWNFDQFAIHQIVNDKANVRISLLRQAPPARAVRKTPEL